MRTIKGLAGPIIGLLVAVEMVLAVASCGSRVTTVRVPRPDGQCAIIGYDSDGRVVSEDVGPC